MGNSNSNNNSRPGDGDGAAETPGVTGRLGGIPRAQAITEGGRRNRASVKLPPKAVKSSQEDWPFIEVRSTQSTVALASNVDEQVMRKA